MGVNWVQVHSCHHLLLFLFFLDPQLPVGWEILVENDYSPGFLQIKTNKQTNKHIILRIIQNPPRIELSPFFGNLFHTAMVTVHIHKIFNLSRIRIRWKVNEQPWGENKTWERNLPDIILADSLKLVWQTRRVSLLFFFYYDSFHFQHKLNFFANK